MIVNNIRKYKVYYMWFDSIALSLFSIKVALRLVGIDYILGM